MSKLFEKFGGMRVEVTWAEMQPLIDGTTAKFPFIEGTDEGGNTTVACFDGKVGYFVTIANPTEEGEFVTAKATATAYGHPLGLNQFVIADDEGNAISSQLDVGVRRLETSGKVSVIGAAPPPLTNSAIIYADSPLIVSANDTVFVIPDGEIYHLQELVSGNEDPTKGAVIEVIYKNATEHVVARMYTAGFSESITEPADGLARDGTACVGNAGGTFTMIVRRTKYSGSAIAIDAEARGYTV
jgi:hypothetical protein